MGQPSPNHLIPPAHAGGTDLIYSASRPLFSRGEFPILLRKTAQPATLRCCAFLQNCRGTVIAELRLLLGDSSG